MAYSSLLDILRLLSGGVCHQLPERSLHLGRLVLPLCARCTGTYLGALLGLATVAGRRRARASLLPSAPTLALFGLFFFAWAIDGANSYLALLGFPHLYEPQNTLRLVTGTLEGLALSLTIWPLAASTLWLQPEPRRVIELRELAAVLAVAALAVLTVSQPLPGVLLTAAVLSDLGLFGMFGLLNALLLTVAFRKEGALAGARDAVPFFVASLALGGLELLLLGLARRWLLGF